MKTRMEKYYSEQEPSLSRAQRNANLYKEIFGEKFYKDFISAEKYENLYGKTKDLKELAELISLAEAFLCSDSAPLHIAVALGVKTYVIFGSTDDKKLIPQSDKVIPIKADCDCPLQPCLWERRQTTCESLDCLKLSASQIVRTILE